MKSNGRSTGGPLLDGDPNAEYVPEPCVKLVEFRAIGENILLDHEKFRGDGGRKRLTRQRKR
jgi:hypothetical protein